jgi:hypothetical protein
MEFEEKFIGFVDILGFRKMLEASAVVSNWSLPELIEAVNTFGVLGLKKMVESDANVSGQSLSELIELLKNLGSPEDALRYKKSGPIFCPESRYIQRDLNFKITQVSDCLLVSSEVSPAGLINLVGHCSTAVLKLLQKGKMCRGYISKGLIRHTDTSPYPVGPGYEEVYSKEPIVAAFKHEADERGTPFVEVDSVVCAYAKECNDQCVKMMFSRMVKDDGNVTVIFPFQLLSHSFMIGDYRGHKFDPEKERRSNENVRLFIKELKERVMDLVDKSNPEAVIKAEHYIEMLNAQLAVCDRTDKVINIFSRR